MKRNTKANKNTKQVTEEPKKRITKKQAPVITETKKTNVSKKGKKNWRKNIDTTEIDKKTIKDLDKKINESKVGALKNEELFTMDVIPNESAKQKFRRELEEKKAKKVKKLSIFEERKIKKMIKSKENKINSQNNMIDNSANLDHLIKIEEKNTDKTYDLWGDSNQTESIFKFPNSSAKTQSRISYPKIPLPHPGQSYNPYKKYVKFLLDKVVDNNKQLNHRKNKIVKIEKQKDINGVKLYESSDEEEDDEEIKDFKVSNNPAIDDGDRMTKKERKQKIRRRLHEIKVEELKKKKEKKIEISNSIGIKKHQKQQQKILKEQEERRLKELQEKKEKERLVKIGLVDE